MVARAKGLPLIVEMDINDIPRRPKLKSALLESLRAIFESNAVMHCHLTSFPSNLYGPLMDLLALRSGETLMSLELGSRNRSNTILGGRAATPEVVFTNLRELRLTRCLWPLSAACYSNLSILEIREPPSAIDLDIGSAMV